MSDRTRVRRMFWLFAFAVAQNRLLHGDGAMHLGLGSQADSTQRLHGDRPERARRRRVQQGASDLLLRGAPGSTAARSPLPVLVFAAALSVLGDHFYYRFCCSPGAVREWLQSAPIASRRGRQAVSGSASGQGIVFACYLSEMFITTTYSMASEPLFAACLSVASPAADPRRGPSGPRNRRRWRARPHRPQPADRAVAPGGIGGVAAL